MQELGNRAELWAFRCYRSLCEEEIVKQTHENWETQMQGGSMSVHADWDESAWSRWAAELPNPADGKVHVLALWWSVGATCNSRRCLALLQWRSKCRARHCSRWSTAAQQTAPSSVFPLLFFLLHLFLHFLFLLLCQHSFFLWALEKIRKEQEKKNTEEESCFPLLFSNETHLCMTISRFPDIVWRRAAYVLQCLWNIKLLQGRKTQIDPGKHSNTSFLWFLFLKEDVHLFQSCMHLNLTGRRQVAIAD